MYPEKIPLEGHAYSPFKKELKYESEKDGIAKYKVIGVTRIIGEPTDIKALDFDAGPLINIGDIIQDSFEVVDFTQEEVFYLYAFLKSLETNKN